MIAFPVLRRGQGPSNLASPDHWTVSGFSVPQALRPTSTAPLGHGWASPLLAFLQAEQSRSFERNSLQWLQTVGRAPGAAPRQTGAREDAMRPVALAPRPAPQMTALLQVAVLPPPGAAQSPPAELDAMVDGLIHPDNSFRDGGLTDVTGSATARRYQGSPAFSTRRRLLRLAGAEAAGTPYRPASGLATSGRRRVRGCRRRFILAPETGSAVLRL